MIYKICGNPENNKAFKIKEMMFGLNEFKKTAEKLNRQKQEGVQTAFYL